MDYTLIDKLHKLADAIEQNESIHCISTCRQAAYTIEKLYKENEQLRALTLKMDLTPRMWAMKQLGKAYYVWTKLQKRIKKT